VAASSGHDRQWVAASSGHDRQWVAASSGQTASGWLQGLCRR